MRTIGVLGGIGPQATMDFEARVHAVAQRLVPQRGNTGYPPLVTVYLRHAPVRLEPDGRPRQPLELDPRLLTAARRLGEWADLLVVTSNTPHLFEAELRAAAGCELISIVDVTAAELRRRGAGPVGLLGLGVPQAQAERIAADGHALLCAPSELREPLDDAILRLMEGRAGAAHAAAARAAVAHLRAAGAAVTVLGCTEIPLLLGAEAAAADLVDPAQLLAEEAVRRALA